MEYSLGDKRRTRRCGLHNIKAWLEDTGPAVSTLCPIRNAVQKCRSKPNADENSEKSSTYLSAKIWRFWIGPSTANSSVLTLGSNMYCWPRLLPERSSSSLSHSMSGVTEYLDMYDHERDERRFLTDGYLASRLHSVLERYTYLLISVSFMRIILGNFLLRD